MGTGVREYSGTLNFSKIQVLRKRWVGGNRCDGIITAVMGKGLRDLKASVHYNEPIAGFGDRNGSFHQCFFGEKKMSSITYLKGDATSPQAKGTKIIGHICNDLGGWGKGFVLAISKRWPEPEADYRKWHKNRNVNDFALGNVRFIQVTPHIHIANMIGQRGMKMSRKGPPIRYNAVEACLEKVAAKANILKASIHLPRIGCGLAGGKWEKIEPLIKKMLIDRNLEVFVYDY